MLSPGPLVHASGLHSHVFCPQGLLVLQGWNSGPGKAGPAAGQEGLPLWRQSWNSKHVLWSGLAVTQQHGLARHSPAICFQTGDCAGAQQGCCEGCALRDCLMAASVSTVSKAGAKRRSCAAYTPQVTKGTTGPTASTHPKGSSAPQAFSDQVVSMCSALVPALSCLQAAAGQMAAITGESPDPGLCVSLPDVPTSVLKAPPQTAGSLCVAPKAKWLPLPTLVLTAFVLAAD